MRPEPIIIVMVSDNKYAQHTGVAIASIIKNKAPKDYIKIHIISDGISKKNKNKILNTINKSDNTKIKFNKFNKRLIKNIKQQGRFPKNVYSRIFFGDLFPKYDKVLYLDSDVVVLSSLWPLFNMDIDNYYIAGARAREFEYANSRLGFKKSNNYINSGIVLFNLKQWRRNNLAEKCIKYAEINNPYAPNQDTTNFICYKKIKEISSKWNAQIFSDTRKLSETYNGFFDAINNPYILHFLTREKPWHPYTKSYKDKHYYFDYLKQTPWRHSVWIYFFQRFIFYFNWSKNVKILRIFGINIIREFRGIFYVFYIPVIGKCDKIWKISAKK